MTRLFILLMISISNLVPSQKTFHDFTVQDIGGNLVQLSALKGKKVLVVNVASECGFTPQYVGLQELYQNYGGEKFTVIAFPSNDFGAQEPGSNEQIYEFCTKEFHVTFPMMSKISVKGSEQAPLYSWLTKSSENSVADAPVTWNFQKFLIGENGQWLATFTPQTEPMSEDILKWLK